MVNHKGYLAEGKGGNVTHPVSLAAHIGHAVSRYFHTCFVLVI